MDSALPAGRGVPAVASEADRAPGDEQQGRVPVGLIASVLAHLAVAALVAVTLLAEKRPIAKDAISVELVPNDPAEEKEKAKRDAGEKAQAKDPQGQPPQPASPPPKPDAATPPAPSAPPNPAAAGAAAAPGVEPVEIPPQLVTGAFDAVGHSDAGRQTTVTREEIDSLRDQVMRCWEIPSGWTNPRQVSVTVRFHLARNGSVSGKPLIVEGPASRLGKTAADNALKALAKCGPYHMPPEKYDQWRDVQLRLAPPQ